MRLRLGAIGAVLADEARVRDLFRELAREDPSVASYRHQLALAHNRIAVIRNETGDPAGAIEEYLVARGILEPLVAEQSAEVRYRALLGIVINNIGLNRQDLGDLRGALADYRETAEVFEALGRPRPRGPPLGQQAGGRP